MHAFDVQSLTKRYVSGGEPANRDITLQIERGEVFGILGDNGAGKSTLVKQLVNLIHPDSGSICFLGRPIQTAPEFLLQHVSNMPQQCNILSHLTVGEVIFHTAFFHGLRYREAHKERDRLLNLLRIEHIGNRVSGSLSGGERRLLQLAVALSGSLPVVILDEPTNELSPQRRNLVWDTLRQLNREQGTTVILVTHDTIEAEKIVQRVGILQKGLLVALGQPTDLKRQLSQDLRLEFLCERDLDLAVAGLNLRLLAPGHWRARVPRSELDNVLQLLARCSIDDFKLSSPSLEDIYIHYATDPE